MARGERVIAISQFVGEHVAQVYGVGPDRLRVIPRGVDIAAFDPRRVNGERVCALATRWRVPEDAAVVMLPGRLTRWKGGLDFIEAIARLGAKQDGVLRNHQIGPDGSYRDTVVFSIIESEWPAVKRHLRFLGHGGDTFCVPGCGGSWESVDDDRQFHSVGEALAAGYQPCTDCRPA